MQRLLHNWVESYVEYTQHTEAPEHFHKWTAIATIGGALRRKVWIDGGFYKWTPNFFIFLVAPAGIANKSTTVSIGMDLLREVPGIKFGPASVTWQALVERMAESVEAFPLPNGEYMPMSAITVEASELGTFFNPRNQEMVNVLVDLWDGKQGVWDKLTKLDSNSIENPWINIIGCTTPSWIAENITDYFSGGGMASRSIFVYADKKRRLVAYPQLVIPPDFAERRAKLVHDLAAISELVGAFSISKNAYEWGTAWYEHHYKNQHPILTGEKFAGYLARRQVHMHKLAMVLSASRGSSLIISEKDLQQADVELSHIELTMPEIYGVVNREREVTLALDVLDYMRNTRKAPKQTVYRHFLRVMTAETFDLILRSLLQAGMVSLTQEGSSIYIVLQDG